MSIPMKKIIDIMNIRKTKNNNYINYEYPKMILISTHDTSLAIIQIFLKNSFNIELDYPYLASNFVIELRKYNYNFYVEIYLNDYLKLNITLEDFEKNISEISYDEKYIINYCFGTKENNIDFVLLILFFIFFVLLIVFLFLSKYCCCKNNKNIKSSISFK